MIKSTLYSILFFGVSFLSFSSCSGSDDVNYLTEGDWLVYERDFTSSDKDLEERLKETIRYAMSLNDYVVKFAPGDSNSGSSSGDNSLLYEEEVYEKATIEEGEPSLILKGRYLQTNYENIQIAIQNLGGIGIWEFQVDIIDINKDHIYMKQTLTSADIEKLCLAYDFGFIVVEEGVTAEFSTKAVKVKK